MIHDNPSSIYTELNSEGEWEALLRIEAIAEVRNTTINFPFFIKVKENLTLSEELNKVNERINDCRRIYGPRERGAKASGSKTPWSKARPSADDSLRPSAPTPPGTPSQGDVRPAAAAVGPPPRPTTACTGHLGRRRQTWAPTLWSCASVCPIYLPKRWRYHSHVPHEALDAAPGTALRRV
eukprot:TRINITY_DN32549_c0_g1_i8.p2 TRINITY_DN32549_c0_g1~~TRINITY_DN32549_c0_g1_i8.p2  ORF type:complete len:181 (+),score=47.99 TRINITY_DN32549_c0_g1_i8:265-807(+)